MKTGVIQKYRERLPLTKATPDLSLGEGDTPLVKSVHIGNMLGCAELYFKLEGCNPTGSFKDRGMVVAVAKAAENGTDGIICASTGNTSSSAAAYGAIAKIPTIVIVPEGKTSTSKLAQANMYGAKVVMIDAGFDQALELCLEISKTKSLTIVNSINTDRLHGQKTAAFEVVESLEDAPDILSIPVGNGGNFSSYWLGFTEARKAGLASTLPKIIGFQADGAAPIVLGKKIDHPKTIASAIRIGNPANWNKVLQSSRQSGGSIESVSDKEIIKAYSLLATTEGIYCEPASAISVAGLLNLSNTGTDFNNQRIVCVITGTGLKDPDAFKEVETPPPLRIDTNSKTVLEQLSFI